MSLYVVTEPTAEPVSLAEVRQSLVVEHTSDDDLLSRLAKSARQVVEAATWRRLVTATLELRLRSFPCGMILLPSPPAIEIEEIAYVDSNGVDRTLAEGDYQFDRYAEPATIEPDYGSNWPSTRCVPGAVAITYTAGYGDPEDVPAPLREAILKLCGHWYANREAVIVGTISSALPLLVESLIEPYRFRDERVLEFV